MIEHLREKYKDTPNVKGIIENQFSQDNLSKL